MTKAKAYIPANDSEFNDFQQNISDEVAANATAWNIDATKATELDTWSTDYEPYYLAIKYKEKRSREQVLAHRIYRGEYEPFLRTFCQSFLVNNMLIPISKRKAMGLNPRGVNHRSERENITTAPIVSLQTLGGGKMKFGFKVASSNKRTGKHPQSNGVSIYYKIVDITESVPLPPVIQTTKVKTLEGSEADNKKRLKGLPTADGFTPVFSPRANFTRQLSLNDIGKILHVYAQWVNTTDSDKDGPFSMVATVVIS